MSRAEDARERAVFPFTIYGDEDFECYEVTGPTGVITLIPTPGWKAYIAAMRAQGKEPPTSYDELRLGVPRRRRGRPRKPRPEEDD
jgi:hypothetical protein